eukprot:TRINITY_DN9089_c0_g1_i1.p1 TRINITY_DN9089_c0_g1~~TRINITY_DN9089_c0_g1_i1.p1  ORF type:complete len:834 (+),score=262.87 TRINITY_DN9089_c0_g1_i1:35-2536(+)
MAKKKSRAATPAAAATKKRSTRRQSAPSGLAASVNPFDRLTAKPKIDVLGRRVRGAVKTQAKATSQAISKRKQSLVREFRATVGNKRAVFEDNRLGGTEDSKLRNSLNAPGAGEGDDVEVSRMLRFQKQRARLVKSGSKFNLEQDDASKEQLTHLGNSLSLENMKDFPDDMPFDAQEEFGGWKHAASTDPDAPKTRKEIMHEIIQKSKQYKAEEQLHKREQEDLRMELDRKFDAEFRKLMKQEELVGEQTQELDTGDYDMFAKELLFESRVAAQERTKTPEERAKEEFEKLQKLEKERLDRMKLNRSASLVLNDKRKNDIEEEDEGEEFDLNNDKKNDGKIEIDSEFELSDSDADEEEDEEEEDDDDDEKNNGEEETSKPKAKQQANKNQSSESAESPVVAGDALAFVYEIPESFDEFSGLLEMYDAEKIATVLSRMRSCNHASFHQANKQKLQKLMGFLMEFVYCCSDFDVLAVVAQVMFEMAQEQVHVAVGLARQHLLRIKSAVFSELRFPEAHEVMMFQLLTHIFPMTDAEHQVTTALWLLMARILVSIPATSCKDVFIGTVLSGMLLEFIADSNKFVPEGVQWVLGCLNECFLRGGKRVRSPKDSALKQLFSFTITFSDSPDEWWDLPADKEAQKMLISWIWKTEEFFDNDSFRSSLMVSLLDLLNAWMQRTRKTSAFVEMSRAFEEVLDELCSHDAVWNSRSLEIKESLKMLVEVSGKTRVPLMMRVKPKEIRQLEPRFIDNVGPETNLNEKGRKSEMAKLKRQVKQEQKGARRELRKDTYILQEEKRRTDAIQTKHREKKQKEAMQFLEAQARDSNLFRRVTKKRKM